MHRLITIREKNFIAKLTTIDGTILSKHNKKEQNIFEFYNNLLCKSIDREVTINLSELGMPSIALHDLEAHFSEE